MEIIKRVPVTKQVSDSIKESIINGTYPVGSRLPSEASFCESLQVSRSSVREAIRELQAEGYIELKTGKGAYVCDNQMHDYDTVRNWFIETAPNLEDFSEVREAIETLAVRLAAERRTDSELAALLQIHEKFKTAAAQNNISEMALLDEQFHTAIIGMAHNTLLTKLMFLVNAELKKYRVMAISVKKNSDNTISEHERIYESIRIQEPRVASSAMLEHLAMSMAEMRRIVQSGKEIQK